MFLYVYFYLFLKRKDMKGGKGTGRSWWRGDDVIKTYWCTGSVFSALRQGKKLQIGLSSHMEGKSGIGFESAAFCLILSLQLLSVSSLPFLCANQASQSLSWCGCSQPGWSKNASCSQVSPGLGSDPPVLPEPRPLGHSYLANLQWPWTLWRLHLKCNMTLGPLTGHVLIMT